MGQYEVEPRNAKQANKVRNSGQPMVRTSPAFLCDMGVTFQKELWANKEIWLTPLSSDGNLTFGDPRCPYGNLQPTVRHWKTWEELPDITCFGKSISFEEFIWTDGNFPRLYKKLCNLHSGEAVEASGHWIPIWEGKPPLTKLAWQCQFAENKTDASLLNDFCAPGSKNSQTRTGQQKWQQCGGHSLTGDKYFPAEAQRQLQENIRGLTTMAFRGQTWAEEPIPSNEGPMYWVWEGTVLTLLQALMLDPVHFTMQESYLWFCQQRKICKNRTHPAKPGTGINAERWTHHRQWYS